MYISLTLLILAIIGSGLTYYFTGLYENLIYLVWFPLLLVVAYYIILLALWLIGLIIISRFYSKKAPQKKIRGIALWPIKEVAWIIKTFFLVRVKVSNKKEINKLRNKNCFIVCNHTSNFDQIIVWSTFKHFKMTTLSKPELENMPIIGRFMHRSGIVTIDRDSPMKAIRAISTSISLLKKDNHACMCVYPEGTRHKDGVLQEFHSTPFLIPSKLECPLVIISMQNANKIKERRFKKITNVYLDVIKVYTSEEVKKMNPEDMASISFKLINDNLNAHKDRNY